MVFEDIFLNGIAEVKYPDSPNEIAISSSLKDTASVLLNDTVELYNLNGSVADYQIVGFLDDTKTSRLIAENLPIVVMTPEGLGTLAVSNANESYVAQFSHLCNIQDAFFVFFVVYHLTDEQITGNTPLLSIQGQIEGKSGVNQIYQVAFILSLIVMLTCILMISSSLNSNVAEITEFFGMLRCLGATKRQIMRYLCEEGLKWCKTAIQTKNLI